MKLVTVDTLQGEKYEEMGIVSGSTIQSKNFVSDFGQSLKSIVGGELGSYTKSEVTEIKSRKYVHTFTLEPSDIGDINIYGAGPEDLR